MKKIIYPKLPNITKEMEDKYPGWACISLDGKILGIGRHTLSALNKARKVKADIDDHEYLISVIYPKNRVIA